MPRLPALYISHGSPMTALEPGRVGMRLAELARDLPRPRAIVIASAHWLARAPLVGGADTPETLHDFGGFPQALFDIRYPAPGDTALTARVAGLLQTAGLSPQIDPQRGLDHGVWVPLRLLYPDADIPVVPVSIQPGLGPAHQFRIGRALAPLRDEGVLVVGSGSITHNLHDWRSYDDARQAPYVQPFIDWWRSGWRPRTWTRCSTTAARPHSRSARIPPTNTCCRCTWRWAPAVRRCARDASTPASTWAFWRWTSTASTANRCKRRHESRRAARRTRVDVFAGWVERSETHHHHASSDDRLGAAAPRIGSNPICTMGFTALRPSSRVEMHRLDCSATSA